MAWTDLVLAANKTWQAQDISILEHSGDTMCCLSRGVLCPAPLPRHKFQELQLESSGSNDQLLLDLHKTVPEEQRERVRAVCVCGS